MTQVQQAHAYDVAISHWRRLKGAPDARTMGVLYWQLNDIWAVSNLAGIACQNLIPRDHHMGVHTCELATLLRRHLDLVRWHSNCLSGLSPQP